MDLITKVMQREWNAHISVDPVSIEGYTKGDLEGYYNSTFLMWESSDGCQPCQVRGMEDKTTWHIDTLDGRKVVHPQTLYRVVIPVGFYIVDNKLVSYQYVLNRSYKKGLSADFARVQRVGKSQRHMRLLDMLEFMYPVSETENARIITRRLAVHEGKLLTHYKGMSVGSYKDGASDTPFPCIQQRLEAVNA